MRYIAMKNALRRYILNALVFLIVTLVFFEAAVRVLLPAPEIIIPLTHSLNPAKTTEQNRSLLSSFFPIYNSSIFYETVRGKRMRPNSAIKIIHANENGEESVLRTNSLGLRGKEPETQNALTALFLGDSITLGEAVNEEKTFVRLTEERINKEYTGQKILFQGDHFSHFEALNGGISSNGLKDYRLLFEEISDSVKPRIVFIGIYLNDLLPSVSFPHTVLPNPVQYLHSFAYLFKSYNILNVYLFPSRERKEMEPYFQQYAQEIGSDFQQKEPEALAFNDPFKQKVTRSMTDWGNAWSRSIIAIFKKELREIKQKTDASVSKLIVTLFPVREQVITQQLYNFPQKEIEAFAKENGIVYVDTLSTLRKEHRKIEDIADPDIKKDPLFLDHCHLTENGHRIVSKEIINSILHLLSKNSPEMCC
jgi:hypothetical protein